MTREEAIEAIKCNWPDSRYTILREALDMAVKALEDVTVVRCRECKYRDGTLGQLNIMCGQMHDDDFCSCGKRKEGADNG